MRRNKERKLIDGLSLIAELKDELENYHHFRDEIVLITIARNEADLDHIIKNKDITLSAYAHSACELKKENFALKKELAKLKGETDELQ